MRTAWSIDEYARCSLTTHHLHSIVEFSSSEDEGKGEDFVYHRHSSDIEHVVKWATSQVQVDSEILPASRQKRSPSERSHRTPALVAIGGEEYTSTLFW